MAIAAMSYHKNAPYTSTYATAPVAFKEDITISSRAYQVEMLEESLKGNVIVVMSTGTGKTHVAVLRIKKELETLHPGKRVWFLAPTKDLCYQQFSVLQSQISSVQIKLFTSDDNVARWTAKENWDAVLTNVNIVVSTYGVLYEALSNGVVDIGSLSLIVFDEAHNCNGKSPGSKIMKDFYFLRKESNLPVPHILGLTPSAIIGKNRNDLENLEKILDSFCRSPRIEKKEFLSYSNRPKLTRVEFQGHGVNIRSNRRTEAMENLAAVHESLDIKDDPEILRLRTTDTEVSRNQLDRKLLKMNTFIQEQMKSFRRRSEEICRTLGNWAADFYISHVTTTFIQSADSKDISLLDWEDSEKQYLANALRSLSVAPQTLQELTEQSISHKFRALLNFLSSCDTAIVGIIFVKERATAYMLHRLLSVHPDSRYRLRCEALVGTSQRPRGRRDVCDLPSNVNALENLRSGKINILVATSVLEEGIDVPQCDLVICFDEPANLKSYIQCRGRARSPGSQWVVMIDRAAGSQVEKLEKWENEMESRYQEEGRNLQNLSISEANETEQCLSRQYRIQSTNALLDMENAKGRLQFFCSRMSSHYSVNLRPEYIIVEEGGREEWPSDWPMLTAKVILPPTLESSLRVGRSKLSWRSAKNATKDAAFEAYLALYRAGLVNEYLLPLSFEEPSRYMEKTDAIVEVEEQYNPWPGIAAAWKREEKLWRREVTLRDQCDVIRCKIEMFIPAEFSCMPSIPIYWNASTRMEIEFGSPVAAGYSEVAADSTERLLHTAFGHRWEVSELKHVVRFTVKNTETTDISPQRVSSRLFGHVDDSLDLPKASQQGGYLFPFLKWLWGEPSGEPTREYDIEDESYNDDQFFITPDRWIRRTDFLHPVIPEIRPAKQKSLAAPSRQSPTDDSSTTKFDFGRFIPSILHKLEVQLIVEQLCTTIFADINLPRRELIRTAISTPVAREQDNYQKLEFLGDSVLKYIVSVYLSSNHANWPEGYLSGKKDAIVSNSRLCRAAIDRGFSKFMLTKVFTGRKWRPLYVDNLILNKDYESRSISSKTVADVVEAIIGAGWKMGGYSTSLSIIKIILPEVDLPSIESGRARLFDLAPADTPLPANLLHLETLAGYSFKKKSLLIEAMSHRSDTTAIASYERIEFLGDAILEVIVVSELMLYEEELSHALMHLYKTALVNNDYLGFIALEWSITQKRIDLKEDVESGHQKEVESEFTLPLWRFMKHGIYGIGIEQQKIERRHASLRHDIQNAISTGAEYPWALLARIHTNKFYADVVESLLGAIWVDSGSIDECKNVLNRMGILPYLFKIVHNRVHVLHPREELSILADGKKVEYGVQLQKLDDGNDNWTCTLSIDESLVSEVANGVCDEEVRTRAAERAVSILRYSNGRTGSPVVYGEGGSRCHKG